MLRPNASFESSFSASKYKVNSDLLVPLLHGWGIEKRLKSPRLSEFWKTGLAMGKLKS